MKVVSGRRKLLSGKYEVCTANRLKLQYGAPHQSAAELLNSVSRIPEKRSTLDSSYSFNGT
jgi:hypothetical protein